MVKKCDETPLLRKLVEKTLAIEIIFTKVFYRQSFYCTVRKDLGKDKTTTRMSTHQLTSVVSVYVASVVVVVAVLL